MLRPATPLAIMSFAAFCLLLLSVLSTPIIHAIPLGSYEGVDFGVFGFCDGDDCSPIEIGYDTSSKFSSTQSATFDLPSSARTTLSAILIVHPVACLFSLIMLGLAIAAHWHGPSHSSRYLLVVTIFGILTVVVCILAFLIDVLLFVPHMAWGSYIVCAAMVLTFLSGIVSCAMRRTVVSRKARKKRIAENAEMSGENYYNRTGTQNTAVAGPSTMSPTVPVLSGANGPADNKLPTFATYEAKKDDRSSDERVPLTSTSPSQRSPNGGFASTDGTYVDRNNSMPSVRRDQYGNPIQAPQDTYAVARGPSQDRMNSRGRGGPYRGRGGYSRGGGYGPNNGPTPPGSRGGYGPGPGARGRGGYGPPRGAYGPNGGRGGRAPPPAYGYGNGADRRPPGPNMYGAYDQARDASPGPSGAAYGANPSMPSVSTGTTGTSGSYQAYNPNRISELPRAESPPPLPGMEESDAPPAVGQAVEMNANTGSPAHPPQDFGHFPNQQIRDSDADVAGMLALQQARVNTPPRRHDTYMTASSRYSQDESAAYVPPRQAWAQGPGRNSPRMPSPLHIPQRPGDMPATSGPAQPSTAAGGAYYEDVDPRFAEPAVPRADPNTYDELAQSGARSPAISEHSTFTSVSQRGVNPRWKPGPGAPGMPGQQIPRRPVNRNEVNILNSNPDFQLPGGRGAPAGRGGMGGGAYPGL